MAPPPSPTTAPAAPAAPPRVLVVGATSAIATAVARRMAARGARLVLLARHAGALAALAADLRVRGAAEVDVHPYDAASPPSAVAAVLETAWTRWGGLDAALVAHGVLPEQAQVQADTAAMLAQFDINARSVVVVLGELANRFEAQGRGVIGVIGSPAGQRGRASNYGYGAAKAAVAVMADGLRHRFAQAARARGGAPRDGVRVVTILPGFVDTPMTAALPKGPLWAQPDAVAADIERALAHANGTLYTPWFWRLIMALVVHLPPALFLRTRL